MILYTDILVHSSDLTATASNVSTNLSESNPISLFIPEPSEIVWSFIIISILAFAVIKVFLPKINSVLDKRNSQIENDIIEAGKLKSEAEELYKNYTNEIKDAKIEAAQIKDNARIDAAKIVENAHSRGASEAELMISNARRMIDSEKKTAETELMKHTNSIAMNIVQKMLNNGVENADRQSRIIDKSLDEYENAIRGRSFKTRRLNQNSLSDKSDKNKHYRKRTHV